MFNNHGQTIEGSAYTRVKKKIYNRFGYMQDIFTVQIFLCDIIIADRTDLFGYGFGFHLHWFVVNKLLKA